MNSMAYNRWLFNLTTKLKNRRHSAWLQLSSRCSEEAWNSFIPIRSCEPCECFIVRVKFCNHFQTVTSFCNNYGVDIINYKINTLIEETKILLKRIEHQEIKERWGIN